MDEYIENDKVNAPFLLAASSQGLIQFIGSYVQDGVLYWKFTPRDQVLTLITQLTSRSEPQIHAKDLFEAIEAFWKQVSKARNSGINYGKNQDR